MFPIIIYYWKTRLKKNITLIFFSINKREIKLILPETRRNKMQNLCFSLKKYVLIAGKLEYEFQLACKPYQTFLSTKEGIIMV